MAVTRGRLFRVSRFFVRPMLGRWTCDIPAPQGPTVYVAHHGNMRGPITTLCYLPFPVRPWVLHTLTRRDTCYVQYRDVTFLGRLGYPRPLAAALAWVTSRYVSAVTQSMGAIPVYRGTVKIGRTFQASVEALQAGEPILLFPDIDYANRGGEIGAVYEGFLLLDRFWRKVSAEPLDFVPLRWDRETRRITAGALVRFDPAANRREETARVLEALRKGINEKA